MPRVAVDFEGNVAGIDRSAKQAAQILTKFEAQAKSLSKSVNTAFATIGVGVSIAGFAGIIKANIDLADNLRDLSKSTGIAVGDLAGLNLAAKQSGTDLEALAQTVNKLSVNIGKDGEKFKALGITAKEPLDALAQLADVFVSIEDDQKRAAVAAVALGKSWQTAAPLLSEGGDAIRGMVADGKRLSGITDEMAEAADKFNDDLEVMNATLAGVGTALTGPVLDGFNQLIGQIKSATKDGLSLTGVLQGIINFAVQADTSTRGLIQSQRDFTAKKIEAMKNNGVIGGLIDDIAGNDINLEKNRLDALNKQLADYDAKQKSVAETAKQMQPPSATKLDAFIGGGGDGGGGKASKAVSDAQREAERAAREAQQHYDQATNSSKDFIRQIQDETAQVGLSESQQANFRAKQIAQTLANAGVREQDVLAFLNESAQVIAANERIKASEEAKQNAIAGAKEIQGIVKDYNKAVMAENDLTQLNYQLIGKSAAEKTRALETYQVELELKEKIAAINETLASQSDKTAAIEEARQVAELAKQDVGLKEVVAAHQEAADQTAAFWEQAARNAQDAMAEFLFDPFKDGAAGMVDNFANALRKMAANYLASELFSIGKNALAGFGSGGSGNPFNGTGPQLAFANSGGGAASGIASIFSSLLGSLASYDVGTPSVPKSGLAIIHKDEAIIPAKYNRQGVSPYGHGSSAVPIVQHITVGNNADKDMVKRAAGQGAREGLAAMNGAQRYR